MKIRTDFVTNSSSSSFVVSYKINKTKELEEYMHKEYGEYGKRLLEALCLKFKDLISRAEDVDIDEVRKFINGDDDCEIEDLEFDIENDEASLSYYIFDPELLSGFSDDDYILLAEYISYTTDGDKDSVEAWLAEHIPDEYKEKIYKTNPH